MGVPVAESPPSGLDAYWLGVWRHALKVMREQGTWTWESKPLLDEYVFALIDAKCSRQEGKRLDWHRAAQRAMSLADQLVLTERARKQLGITSDDAPPESAFDALDGAQAS